MTKVLRMGYAAPATLPLVCPQVRPRSLGVCLLRSIRTVADLSALVLTVLVEQVSELLGRPPEEIDPRYDADS